MATLTCVQKHSVSCLSASLVVCQRVAFVRRRPRRIGAALERTGSRPRRSCRNATRQALADLRGTEYSTGRIIANDCDHAMRSSARIGPNVGSSDRRNSARASRKVQLPKCTPKSLSMQAVSINKSLFNLQRVVRLLSSGLKLNGWNASCLSAPIARIRLLAWRSGRDSQGYCDGGRAHPVPRFEAHMAAAPSIVRSLLCKLHLLHNACA